MSDMKRVGIIDLLVDVTKYAPSRSEARRLVEQGGVTYDGEVIKDARAVVDVKGGEVLKVGKRKFARIK